MKKAKKLELLDQQIAAANGGHPADFGTWRNTTEVVLRSIFGEASATHSKFQRVRYTPGVYFSGQDVSGYQPAGVRQAVSILESAKLEVELADDDPAAEEELESAVVGGSSTVFIVHGQDDGKKNELAIFLRDLLDSEPIVLHQQANHGRTLIEKFEQHAARASFAVVILSADDEGRSVRDVGASTTSRARQNVVFEMGFFFGALGRSRVVALYEQGVELPSDLNGLVYVPMDRAGAWRALVAREMAAVGISVDPRALLK